MSTLRAFLAAVLALFAMSFPSAAAPPDVLAAVRSGDVARVQAALDAGADVNATDGWGRTPLLVATQLRNTAAVRLLIARGARLDAANRNDITPLIAAAQTGNVEAVQLLLEAGAAVDRRDNLGWSALEWATQRKQEEIAGLLRARGADDATAPAPLPASAAPARRLQPAADPARISKGAAQAPITIYEYTDFQCPYCRHGARVLDEAMARYEGEVRLVVKHLPLPALHPMALPAARYFEALAMQSPPKAWAFYDRVFAEQPRLAGGEAWLRQVAGELGADLARLDAELASATVGKRVAADMEESARFGFDGVPAFIVGDEVIEGAQPLERFVEAIERARRR